MSRSVLLAMAAAGALASCEKPRTEIVLTIDSNLVVPSELAQVHVAVASEKSATRFDQTYTLGPGRTELPIVLGLVPESDKSLGFRAVAEGLLEGAEVVERSAVTSFVPDQTLALYLDLLRVCVRTTCPTGQTCGPDGRCIPESVPPSDLPPYGLPRDAGVVGGFDGGIQAPDGASTSKADATSPAEDIWPDRPDLLLDAGLPRDMAPEGPVSDAPAPPVDGSLMAGSDAPADVLAGPRDASPSPGPLRVVGQFTSGGISAGRTYTVIGSFVWAGGSAAGRTWGIGPL